MDIVLNLQQISKITGLNSDDLKSKLETGEAGELVENAPDLIVELTGNRLKENTQKQFNIATSKIATKLEKIIKSAGIEDFENVEEAVQKLADAKKASEQGEGGKSIDFDTLKLNDLTKIPAFQAFREAKEKELSDLKTENEKIIKSQKLSETSSKVRNHSFSYLEEKLAKFSPDKDFQLDAILQFIPIDRLEWNEKAKDFFILDADGQPELDNSANPKKYLDTLTDKWGRLYGFNETDPNKKTPAPKPGVFGQNKQQQTGIKFDDYAAAVQAVRTARTNEDRASLQKAMNEQFPNGKPT